MGERTIFHVHTYRCQHTGEEREEEYVKNATELGATKLIFTDHAPFPENPFRFRMSMKELSEYIIVLRNLKEKYAEVLEIKIGLEVEFVPIYMDYYHRLLEQWNVDILLLGEHFSLLSDGRYMVEMVEKNLETISKEIKECAVSTGIILE